MKNNKTLKSILGMLTIVALFLGWNYRVEIAQAAAPYFVRVAYSGSSTATTSGKYMTPGTATTTVTTDLYSYGLGVGELNGDMDLRMNLQLLGSSTATNLKYRNEYSNGANCGNAPLSCDWYQESNPTTPTATTTLMTIGKDYSMFAASSTIGVATVPDNRSLVTVKVPINARWVRTVFFLPPGSANGYLYAEVLGVTPRQ